MDLRVSSPNVDPRQGLLDRFFAEFLDESAFSEYRRVERTVASLKRQGQTVSGYPIIRPNDCSKITVSLENLFQSGKPYFRTRDSVVTDRFEEIVYDFYQFCAKTYPNEAMGVLILRANVKMFMNRPQEAINLVSHYALRPYAVENSISHCSELVELFAQASLQLGTLSEEDLSFIAFGRWLLANDPSVSAGAVATRMAPFVSFGPGEDVAKLRSSIIKWASVRFLRVGKGRVRKRGRSLSALQRRFYRTVLALSYLSLKKSGRRGNPFSLKRSPGGAALVTRAMGGIGDLLMMGPGLEALAKKQNQRVDFAISRKFFPIFQHNPHVRLVDVDGPRIDFGNYKYWINLSICPAGQYESKVRPNVKIGRVELFARAMRVRRDELLKQGWKVNYYESDEEGEFAEKFISDHNLGRRKIVGVQPYSRDSYKDHPRINEVISRLSEKYDVIIFHHLDEGLPSGKNITSTAGVPLGRSLALVSRLNAMVCVDSAFLHAAAAFDVPVIALFGPTDARTFTRHHKKVTILWKPQEFGCVPCWRNEDMPCIVTGMQSASPCVGAIKTDEILGAVDEAMG
jgi:ADP-heptose:LPS heptosyltransferase